MEAKKGEDPTSLASNPMLRLLVMRSDIEEAQREPEPARDAMATVMKAIVLTG